MSNSVGKHLWTLWTRLFGRPAFRRLNMGLLLAGLRGLGVLNYLNHKVSGEQHLWSRIGRTFAPGDFIFDVGANRGNYSELVLQHTAGAARIVAFEPNETCVRLLRQRFGDRIKIEDTAVGSRSGGTTLYLPPGDGFSELASTNAVAAGAHGDVPPNPIDVRCTSLDDYIAAHQISSVAFLKVDVEGAEAEVLAGVQNTLAAGGILVLQFEYNVMNFHLGQRIADITAFLPGYKLYRILPHGLLPLAPLAPYVTNIYAFQNIIAVAPEVEEVSPALAMALRELAGET